MHYVILRHVKAEIVCAQIARPRTQGAAPCPSWLNLALTCQDDSWGSSHPITFDMMHHERAQARTSVQWVYQLNLISTKVAGFIPALLACSSCVCLCSLTRDSGSRSQFKDAHNRLWIGHAWGVWTVVRSSSWQLVWGVTPPSHRTAGGTPTIPSAWEPQIQRWETESDS